ncbi:MAG: DUF4407 domain-containing protein [Polyangiales bacterium]
MSDTDSQSTSSLQPTSFAAWAPDGAVQPGAFTRFLWFAAGADASLLRRCPASDWVKYQGIGGIVFATTVLAFVSASYAFYTVFSPKTDTALAVDFHVGTCVIAVIAGALWSLVIFNIDRFIVSSTGKGDGTESITWTELQSALPRIVMAVIIGVCISAPLEIRILKPEIDAQLELEQHAYLQELNRHTEGLFQTRKDELVEKIDKAQAHLKERRDYFESRRVEIGKQRRLLELEAEGKTTRGVAGRGPAWRDKKETLDKMEAELQRDRKVHEQKAALFTADIQGWKESLKKLGTELAAAKHSNGKQARHLDGLMKRIHISHEIGGVVPWAILLLLLAVETGPIFFKMMLVSGTYDYMLENAKRVATARLGVELEAQVFLSETGEEIRIDTYHAVHAALEEERRRLASEKRLAEAVHQRFQSEIWGEVAQGDAYKKYIEPS